MQVYLDKYLHENFGDLYTTKIKTAVQYSQMK